MMTVVNSISNVMNLVRPSVLELTPYASAKDAFKDFKKDLIYMDANENPYQSEWNRYPDPDQLALKEALSQLNGISTDQLLLGNGSDEILDMIYRVFCEPKADNVIINTPTFGMYKVLAGMHQIACKEVLLTNDFQLDIQRIVESVDAQTKILFICSPNNPTGNLMNKEDVLSLVKSLNIIVVIDEAYIDFADSRSWLKEVVNYKNLIVTQTLSKAYGMAGLRLGICYADAAVISLLKKVKMPYNVNILTQKFALKNLENKSKFKKEISEIILNKGALKSELLQIAMVQKIYPSDANFLLVKVDDANKRYAQLLNNGIVVRNRNKEPMCENCLRITVGTAMENKKLIEVFKTLK